MKVFSKEPDIERSESTHVCKACGKNFIPEGRNKKNQKYCTRTHYSYCEYCGKEFIQPYISSDIKHTCSRECTNKLRIQKCNAAVKEKYGVDNISQSAEFKDKISASIKASATEAKEKSRQTCKTRYGCEYPLQNKEILKRAQQTCLDRYGVANPAQNSDVQIKISEALQSENSRSKYRDTSIAHYGVDHPAKSSVVVHQMKQTCLDRYGAEWAIQNSEIKSRMVASQQRYFASNSDYGDRLRQAIHESTEEKYGVDWPCMLPQCRNNNGNISQTNKHFHDMLLEHGIESTFEYHIGSKSYDLCIEKDKLLVEIDPTYTHNVVGNHWSDGVDVNYHIDKSRIAAETGYRCIHIFDWDDVSKIINIITSKQRLYARNLVLKGVPLKDCNQFLNIYHLQGSCRGQLLCLGLYHNNHLVQVMTFGHPRYNHNYHWELLRLCTHPKYKVVGGASRLFKHFIDSAAPQSIISYCDVSKFTGNVYQILGMQLAYTTPPNKHWSKGNQHITDNLLRQRGFDQLFNTNYGKGTSNEELMLEHGWLPVYDCGQSVYVWYADDENRLHAEN